MSGIFFKFSYALFMIRLIYVICAHDPVTLSVKLYWKCTVTDLSDSKVLKTWNLAGIFLWGLASTAPWWHIQAGLVLLTLNLCLQFKNGLSCHPIYSIFTFLLLNFWMSLYSVTKTNFPQQNIVISWHSSSSRQVLEFGHFVY